MSTVAGIATQSTAECGVITVVLTGFDVASETLLRSINIKPRIMMRVPDHQTARGVLDHLSGKWAQLPKDHHIFLHHKAGRLASGASSRLVDLLEAGSSQLTLQYEIGRDSSSPAYSTASTATTVSRGGDTVGDVLQEMLQLAASPLASPSPTPAYLPSLDPPLPAVASAARTPRARPTKAACPAPPPVAAPPAQRVSRSPLRVPSPTPFAAPAPPGPLALPALADEPTPLRSPRNSVGRSRPPHLQAPTKRPSPPEAAAPRKTGSPTNAARPPRLRAAPRPPAPLEPAGEGEEAPVAWEDRLERVYMRMLDREKELFLSMLDRQAQWMGEMQRQMFSMLTQTTRPEPLDEDHHRDAKRARRLPPAAEPRGQ